MSTHGVPFATEPGRTSFGGLDGAIHIPLRPGLFETLGHNLFAAAFDGATANQVPGGAELVTPHPMGIIGKVGDRLAGFFAARGQLLTRLDDGRHIIDPLLGGDGPRRALDGGATPAEIIAGWRDAEGTFERRRRPFLLYE